MNISNIKNTNTKYTISKILLFISSIIMLLISGYILFGNLHAVYLRFGLILTLQIILHIYLHNAKY